MADEITLNGKTYREVDKSIEYPAIVVLDRGFVLVGRITCHADLDREWLTIENCNCVRRWGTTVGIGEIATNGPTSKTVLDPQPFTRVPMSAVIQIITCNKEKWK